MQKILVTGSSGFIGYHLCKRLLDNKKFMICGFDTHNKYYDVNLKEDRLKILKKYSNFKFFKLDISNKKKIFENFKRYKYSYVVNLAAQAGVRYSITNPRAYMDSNIIGFFNIIEACRMNKIKHFLFASSSSVYGNSNKFPLNEKSNTDKPLSFYGATKKCNEVIAYSYSNIYHLPSTSLRFFTVYGPYGRPDMALFKFTKLILGNKKIDLYGRGKHERDFTYINDVIDAVQRLIFLPPKKTNNFFNVFNISSNKPQKLIKYVSILERSVAKTAKKNFLKLQQGDVLKTHGDIKILNKYIGYKPKFNLHDGINKFVDWYKNYYKKINKKRKK